MSSRSIFSLVGSPYEAVVLLGSIQPQTVVQTFTAATFAVVPVPASSIGVLVIPDNANTGTVIVKGITGDTGINIRKFKPSLLSLDEAAASFGILSANTQTMTLVFF